MMLTGTFNRLLDDKCRFAIPKRLRDQMGEPPVLYLAPGTDGSLSLYTEAEFQRVGDRLSQSSPTGREVRAFSRLFYAQVESVELDRQGRVRVPQELAVFAGLQKEIVLLGVRDHLEIWDRNRWEGYIGARHDSFDAIAESAFEAAERSTGAPLSAAAPASGPATEGGPAGSKGAGNSRAEAPAFVEAGEPPVGESEDIDTKGEDTGGEPPTARPPGRPR